MISSSREANYKTPKQEKTSEGNKISKASWSRLKDPRIVRVSRAFGGKDRHSKVCTVRGLRDRRVRLSVPTAIQLYDLQHRLGLNQPSKVVDWLLNVAKHEIDKLPPLQMPPGNLSQLIHQPIVSASQSADHDKSQAQFNSNYHLGLSNDWSNSDLSLSRMKSTEIVQETAPDINKESWTKGKQDEDLGHGSYTSTTNFFHRANHQSNSLTSCIQNPSSLGWDPLSLSHTEDHLHHNFNVVPLILPSTSLSVPSGSQFVVYPPVGDYDPTKQMINFQMLSSTSTSQTSPFSNLPFTPPLYTVSQSMRPFQISTNPYSGPNKDN